MVTAAVSQREGERERTDRAVIRDCIRNGGERVGGRDDDKRKRGKIVRFRFKLGFVIKI